MTMNGPSIDFKVPPIIRNKTKMISEYRHLIDDYELYVSVKHDRFSEGKAFYLQCKGYFNEREIEFIEKYYAIPDFLKTKIPYLDFDMDPDIIYVMQHPDTHFYFIEAVRLIYSI